MHESPVRSFRFQAVVSDAHLASYRRCAELLTLQHAAFDAGDLERVNELSARIDALHAEIAAGQANETHGITGASAAEEARELIRVMIDETERLTSRLGGLRGARLREIRDTRARRPQARRYVAGEGGSDDGRARRLDVTS